MMARPCAFVLGFLCIFLQTSTATFCGYIEEVETYQNTCFECDVNPSKITPFCNASSRGNFRIGARVEDPLNYSCFLKCPVNCTFRRGDPTKCCEGYHGPNCDIDIDACVSSPCTGPNERCYDRPADPNATKVQLPGGILPDMRICGCNPGYTKNSSGQCTPTRIIELRQSDFSSGTYQINQSGWYKLMENISFNPHSKLCGNGNNGPTEDQFSTNGGPYDRRAFALGFFAAISVQASSVVIDLNGYTLEQSIEHALQQRFYAHIELSNSPFHYDQGPHNFTVNSSLFAPTDIVIKNGRLGRSSHHGIHGHASTSVTITDLIIDDFEVAGISLNGASQLTIERVIIGPSRHDVPVRGIFSTGRFILPYVKAVIDACPTASITIQGRDVLGSEILSKLQATLDDTFDAVVKGKGTIPDLVNNLDNRVGLPDGSAIYGIVLHSYGSHTNGFTWKRTEQTCLDGDGEVVGMVDEYDFRNGYQRCATGTWIPSGNKNIRIKNVKIQGLDVNVNEVEAVKSKTFDKQVNSTRLKAAVDVVGAVYQYEINADDKGFTGNDISNAQLFVSKHKVSCLTDPQAANSNVGVAGCQRKTSPIGATCGRTLGGNASKLSIDLDTIPQSILDWAATGGRYQPANSDFVVCGGDNMFHVNKGAMGIRIDGTNNVLMQNIEIDTVRNSGKPVSKRCGQATFLHPEQMQPWYTGTDSVGIAFSAAQNVEIIGTNYVRNIISSSGNAYGVQIRQVSDEVNGKLIMGQLTTLSGTTFQDNLDVSIEEIYKGRPPIRPKYAGVLPTNEIIFIDDYACIPGDGMDFDMSDPMMMNMAVAPVFDPLSMTCDIITDLETQKTKPPWSYTPPTTTQFMTCDETSSGMSSNNEGVSPTVFAAVVSVFAAVLVLVTAIALMKLAALRERKGLTKSTPLERPGSLTFNNPVSDVDSENISEDVLESSA